MSIELKDDLPCMPPEVAKKAMENYQAICAAMLSKDDYSNIQGKDRKNKSAWRKLARAFYISDEIVKEEKEVIPSSADGKSPPVIVWRYWVKATAQSGRSSLGVGACSSSERKFAHPEHDIQATAHTRAKNRAIADLIGSGEVSAEEIDAMTANQKAQVFFKEGAKK